MVEVVFSESAGGSLGFASINNKHTGGVSTAVIASEQGDGLPNREEIEKIMREQEEKERLNWESAVPLNIKRRDILCFPLALSFGSIVENGIGKQREEALNKLFSIYPEEVKGASQEMLKSSEKNLKELISRAEEGEEIRIWTSDTPDDACGICWLIEQLKPLGFENLNVTCVKLPDFHVMSDGTVVMYSGWGEVCPHQWGHLAKLGKKLPADYMYGLSFKWEKLKSENSALRAVVNRQLVSVSENFYDDFILKEIDAQEKEFMEAKVIGTVFGKYPFGIGDGLIALRIEEFIKKGMLETVTKADSGDVSYYRILRKCY